MTTSATESNTGTDPGSLTADGKQPTVTKNAEDGAEVESDPPATRNRVTVSLRRDVLVLSGLLLASLACIGILGWRLHADGQTTRQVQSSLSAMQETTNTRTHVEKVALDYAVGAADMNYEDLPAWSKRLTTNTSPELTKKLTEAATSMEQVIVPLQWVSTPTPITATVRSDQGGIFVVNCFVSVVTKNVQAPDGIQSTATYTVTIDANNNSIITDVGGVDSALKAGK